MTFDADESITGLIKKPPEQYIPPARYVSKFRNSVRSASIFGKAPHKTLGVPNVPLKPPTEFLRKRSRPEVKRSVEHKHYHIPGYQHKLPPWEKVKQASGESDKDKPAERDFKKRNIDNAKSLEALKPRMYYVDDKRGNSYPLVPSGLYPLYRDTKSTEEIIRLKAGADKGATKSRQFSKKLNSQEKELLAGIEKTSLPPRRPSQDEKSKKEQKSEENGEQSTEIEAKTDTKLDIKVGAQTSSKRSAKSSENDSKPSIVKKSQKKQMCRYITEAERTELLYGMKKMYEEIMRKFQVLPFLTDTPPKVKRKAKMEEDLKQLEKDIDLIERHPHIYVYENDE